MPPIADVEAQAQRCTAGRIEGHAIYFRGICADCISAQPEESQ
jgi:Fe2+ or Zn2+ uptake regulation protein